VPTNVLTLVQDCREKQPWALKGLKYKLKRVVTKLETGDYSFAGYENQIAIEKKGGLKELTTNISAIDRERFKAALKRLSQMPVRYLVIEDSLDRVHRVIRELPPQARIDAYSVFNWVAKICVEYKIPMIFVGFAKSIKEPLVNSLIEHIIEFDIPNLKQVKNAKR